MGLAAPFVLNGKILLQSLCKRDLHWDEPITGTDTCRWKEWLTELPNLESLLIPRCYKPKDFGSVVSSQMHTFSDASEQGYGMVSYLRLTDENNRIHCSFVMGKALKRITIPRMELTAASFAVRIASTITKELDYTVNESFFWTDSLSTLRYIANENTRFHTFVANRVAIIRDATRLDQWRYIESSTNPADCVSRGLSMNKFLSYQQWFNGPDFLWKDEVAWPQDSESSKIIPPEDAEIKRVINTAVLENFAQATMNDLFSHFSDWTKLRKTVAWMLMAIKNLRNRVLFRKEVANRIEQCEQDPAKRAQRVESAMSIDNHKRLKGAKDLVKSVRLNSDILRRAEIAVIKCVQAQHFGDELDILTERQHSRKIRKSSPVHKLDPIIVNGILRVGGRLEEASISYEAKHPVVLPKDSPVSRLIIEHTHKTIGHLGKNSILAVLRKKYWILGANGIIKRMTSRCVTCRRYQAPCGEQKVANLPGERLVPDEPPFSRTGMDYFGHF